jgi:Predicted permease
MQAIRSWFERYFSNPQVVGLTIVLMVGFGVVIIMGNMLAPVIASVVIAYLLEGLVGLLERRSLPRLLAVLLVFLAFMTFLLAVMFGLLPLLSHQVTQLAQQLPYMIERGQHALMSLPVHYPDLFSDEQVNDLSVAIRSELGMLGQKVVSLSLASVRSLITFVVYLVIVPFLIFFFLKDKYRLLAWLSSYLPRQRGLALQVWSEVDMQIGNYVRGKFIEILIVWLVSFITFKFLGLQFSMLLGVLVGLSTLVPYVGAVVATLPIGFIAYSQWGLSAEFVQVLIAYGIIQALDGIILVPLLFSEVVDLHPVAIIVAVLVFGGLWGFWGIFFAIPLATLVQAILKAWPRLPPSEQPPMRQAKP